MSSDNGIVSHVQDKTFGRMRKTFGAFWFYFKALSMTKDLLGLFLLEFKDKLPDSEYANSQTKKQRDNCNKKRMVMDYFGITLTSLKLMIKVKNLRTEEWPSGRAYLLVEELEETFRPKDMFSNSDSTRKDRTLTVLVRQIEAYKLNIGTS